MTTRFIPPTPPVPPTLNYMQAGPDRTYVRLLATQQRNIMLCILVYLAAVVSQFLLPVPMRPILGVLGLAVVIFAMVCVFRLATRIYGTAIGVTYGILTLIPLVGLIILLIVNGKATAILREHGLKVGLLGTDPKAIDRL